MELNYIKLGAGKPLLILNGLFGSLDNWKTLGNRFAENFEVYLIDQRNHGKSPHSYEFNYNVMPDDLIDFMDQHGLEDVYLLGHSMGGKTAMSVAQESDNIEKLIVADIAPKAYKPHHNNLVEAMEKIDFSKFDSRSEVDKALAEDVQILGVRQFLMKNVYWREKGVLDWKINLPIIKKNMVPIAGAIHSGVVDIPTLFIRGEASNYILDEDMDEIRTQFPKAQFAGIPGAGHWLHAEDPELFYKIVMDFLN